MGARNNEKRIDDPANPSRVFDQHGRLTGWCWYNEHDEPSKLYYTEHAALHDLLYYSAKLPWWKRWWMKLWRRT
jgi:hypothetical protein